MIYRNANFGYRYIINNLSKFYICTHHRCFRYTRFLQRFDDDLPDMLSLEGENIGLSIDKGKIKKDAR